MQLSILVKYPTHAVTIKSDSEANRICCFKYNRRRCDIQLYSWQTLDELSDYIREPLPSLVWYIHLDDDSGEPE